MSRTRSLELRELRAPKARINATNLNTLHVMLDNEDIEHAIPLATKLFRKNMLDDIADKFFNYLRLNAYREYPTLVKEWFKTLYDRSMTDEQQKTYNEIIGYRSKKFKRIISSRFITTTGKKRKSVKKGKRVVKTVIRRLRKQ